MKTLGEFHRHEAPNVFFMSLPPPPLGGRLSDSRPPPLVAFIRSGDGKKQHRSGIISPARQHLSRKINKHNSLIEQVWGGVCVCIDTDADFDRTSATAARLRIRYEKSVCKFV